MKIDLRQLRHLLAIDRHRNFARAADALGLTQPGLTRSLQMLEKSVGARLFDRDRAHVEPTAVGTGLIERARPLLDQARQIEWDLARMLEVEIGLLRIGAGPFASELSVGVAIGRLLRSHPQLLADLSAGDWPALQARVISGELDLAVSETSLAVDDGRLCVEPLPKHRGVLFCRANHPLLAPGRGSDALSLHDVGKFPLVLASLPFRFPDWSSSAGSESAPAHASGLRTPRIRVESLALARSIVLESDAVSVAVPRQIAEEIRDGRFVALPLAPPWLETSYGIIRRADRTLSPAADAFLKILKQVEAELA